MCLSLSRALTEPYRSNWALFQSDCLLVGARNTDTHGTDDHMRTQGEAAVCKPGQGLQEGPALRHPDLLLQLPGPRTDVCGLSCLVHVILLRQHAQTNTSKLLPCLPVPHRRSETQSQGQPATKPPHCLQGPRRRGSRPVRSVHLETLYSSSPVGREVRSLAHPWASFCVISLCR